MTFFVESLDTFEACCWKVHIIPGSYRMGDLASMGGGFVQVSFF